MFCNVPSVLRNKERDRMCQVWWYNTCNPNTWKSEKGKSQHRGQQKKRKGGGRRRRKEREGRKEERERGG